MKQLSFNSYHHDNKSQTMLYTFTIFKTQGRLIANFHKKWSLTLHFHDTKYSLISGIVAIEMAAMINLTEQPVSQLEDTWKVLANGKGT